MTHDPGHSYSFSGPPKGWPSFDPQTGKIIRDPAPCRSAWGCVKDDCDGVECTWGGGK